MENLTSTVAFWPIKHEPDIAERWLERQQLRANVLVSLWVKIKVHGPQMTEGGVCVRVKVETCTAIGLPRQCRLTPGAVKVTSTVGFWTIKHEPDIAE
jgi:hypothetical protein